MNRKLAIGLLVSANIMWGSSYAVAKVALEELPPPLLGALRISLAAVLIWLVLSWQARGGAASGAAGFGKVERRDAIKLAGLGFCGVALDYFLGYWGVSLTTATDASLMIIGEVIFTTLLAVWLLGERFSLRKMLVIAAGTAGVATLVFGNVAAGQGGAGGLGRAAGDLLILAGLFAASIYSVSGAGLARKYRPLTILAYAYAGSMLLWAPLLIGYLVAGAFPTISLKVIVGVIYLAVVTSLICHLVWFHVLSVTGAHLGAISLFVQPLVGSLIGLLVLGDPLTPTLALGAALVFTALYFTTIPERAPSIECTLPEASVSE